MSRAFCLIRNQPVYRRDAFVHGLRACGYQVQDHISSRNDFRSEDVLVIWNRYGDNHSLANHAEAKGALVLVAENGYVGNDRNNRTRYAISRHGHNGIGAWSPGGPERWEALGVEVKPWRESGEHILVCPNRSFGMPGFFMPPHWPESARDEAQRRCSRAIRVRPHPGGGEPKVPLADDLRNAWAVVIWSSSVGVEALIQGIPVICLAPRWIARDAAVTDISLIKNPPLLDRMPSLHRLAWAQWNIEEIESGKAFRHLCQQSS